ncbi:hypothetical protein C8J57DRAFT_1365751 [Mycena rebaudengoi]|nr:hypothetical protein C8J57DRAFT_1365751 [Mycena rebaudengoi]
MAVINPAHLPLAAHFHKTTVEASYQTTIAIAFDGIGSFLWVPSRIPMDADRCFS